MQVCCWRPKPQSWMEYLKGYFLGAYPQLRNPDLVYPCFLFIILKPGFE